MVASFPPEIWDELRLFSLLKGEKYLLLYFFSTFFIKVPFHILVAVNDCRRGPGFAGQGPVVLYCASGVSDLRMINVHVEFLLLFLPG